jgi:hypothetical protein
MYSQRRVATCGAAADCDRLPVRRMRFFMGGLRREAILCAPFLSWISSALRGLPSVGCSTRSGSTHVNDDRSATLLQGESSSASCRVPVEG